MLLRKRPGVLIAAATIGIAIALQMYGSHWHLAGVSVRSPLGFLQDRIALTRDILPGRFAIAMWIAVAWLFAVALDQALRRTTGNWRVAAIVAAVVCLVAAAPREPGAGPRARRRSRRCSRPRCATRSRRDATVMLAPMAAVGFNVAQLWQIKAKMRFRQVGGYALHTIGPDGAPSYYPYPKTLTRLFMIKYATGQPYEQAGDAPPSSRRPGVSCVRPARRSSWWRRRPRAPAATSGSPTTSSAARPTASWAASRIWDLASG